MKFRDLISKIITRVKAREADLRVSDVRGILRDIKSELGPIWDFKDYTFKLKKGQTKYEIPAVDAPMKLMGGYTENKVLIGTKTRFHQVKDEKDCLVYYVDETGKGILELSRAPESDTDFKCKVAQVIADPDDITADMEIPPMWEEFLKDNIKKQLKLKLRKPLNEKESRRKYVEDEIQGLILKDSNR